jgi:hypothetical protein
LCVHDSAHFESEERRCGGGLESGADDYLNNCDPAYGLVRANAIRKTIEERPVETSAGPVSITMSLGDSK